VKCLIGRVNRLLATTCNNSVQWVFVRAQLEMCCMKGNVKLLPVCFYQITGSTEEIYLYLTGNVDWWML